MKGMKQMKLLSVVLLLVYVLCSALGLTLIKMGMNQGSSFSLSGGAVSVRFTALFILGALLYICSFLLSMFVLSKLQMNLFYPISAGLIYILVTTFSVLLLKENFSVLQLAGAGLILGGIVLINLK